MPTAEIYIAAGVVPIEYKKVEHWHNVNRDDKLKS